jgi:hypothetical protein
MPVGSLGVPCRLFESWDTKDSGTMVGSNCHNLDVGEALTLSAARTGLQEYLMDPLGLGLQLWPSIAE